MLWDTQSALLRAARTPATGLPVEFGRDALVAGYRQSSREELSFSLSSAIYDEYDRYLDRVEQAGGGRLPNPIASPRLSGGPFRPSAAGDLERPIGAEIEQDNATRMRLFEDGIREKRAKNPAIPEPPTAGQLLDGITNRLRVDRETYADLAERQTLSGTVAGFIGSMGAFLTDPAVIETLPAGGGGRTLVQRMLAEAGISGAQELMMQPFTAETKSTIESPYTAREAAANVLAAAGLGAAFPAAGALLHAGGSKAATALRRLYREQPEIPPAISDPHIRPATPDESAALNAFERDAMAEESSPAPVADLPAHLDMLEREAEFVREEGAPSGAVPEVPIEPARAAEVEASMRLDDTTAAEIGALAKEDADLGRAMEVMESIRAYHGSPHRFDRFSMEGIGTGEGAQAFGRGLYFAESPGVAKDYQQKLAPAVSYAGDRKLAEILPDDEQRRGAFGYYDAAGGDIDKAIATAEIDLQSAGDDFYRDMYRDAITGLRTLKEAAVGNIEQRSPGALYTVDLAVSRDELLDWDKPLSEQPAKVREAVETHRAALERHWGEVTAGDEDIAGDPWRTMTGADLYQQITRGADPAAAAEALRAVGIKGIQYLDAGSRADGEGSRNIVMFDDSAIHIREINGQPIPDPVDAAKELAEFTGSKAEDAALTADVERALDMEPEPQSQPMTPEQIAANKKLRRSMAARKAALTEDRSVVMSNGRPKSLLAWVKGIGGIRDSGGELEARDLRTARPGTVRRNGYTIERAAFMAWEDGYLGDATRMTSDGIGYEPDPDLERMFIQAIDDELRGKKHFSDNIGDDAAARAEQDDAERAADIWQHRVDTFRGRAEEAGIDASDDMLAEALQRSEFREEGEFPPGYDALDVLVHLIEEDAIRLADDWEAPVAAVDDDIPLDLGQAPRADRSVAGAQQAAGSDAGRPAGAETRGQEPARDRAASEDAGAGGGASPAAVEWVAKSLKQKPDKLPFLKGIATAYVYWSPYRPISKLTHELPGEIVDGSYLRLDEKLTAQNLADYQLVPLSIKARTQALLDTYPGETIELKHGSRDAVALVSADPRGDSPWRVTFFDVDGPSGHIEADSLEKAVAEALQGGYNEPAPGLIDDIMGGASAPSPKSEPGAEGFDQLIIPGAERSAQQAMDARAGRGMQSKAPQQGLSDGLFGPMDDPSQMEIPVAEAVGDGVETKTAKQLLDELEREQKTLDAMNSCAAPLPMPKGPKA